MPQNQPPPRPVLRQLLRAVLPTDSDFCAFCVDFFPKVSERFSSGMDRVAQATLLLELTDAEHLFAALREHDTERFEIFQRRRTAPVTGQKNPYRGLAAFQQGEAHLFFGRETLTGQLWQKFEALCEKPDATRLLAIVGPSGSGKSSVARAGLFATFVKAPLPGPQAMRIRILKPGERPIESLARVLVPLLPADSTMLPASRQVAIENLLRDKEIPGQGLRRFVADLSNVTASPVCLLVDQLEELYTLCQDPAERDIFVETLLDAAADTSRQVSIVLTLRSDFLGETQRQHPELNRLIAAQHELVPAMTMEELRHAIANPAKQAGRPIDESTVESLLTEARGSQGALPLLEFALTRIWEGIESGEEPGVTLRKIGGVGGALAGEAQKIYKSLSESEQKTARRALVRLVRLGDGTRDTRRRAPIGSLCGQSQPEAEVLKVLRRFSTENARLVTLYGDGITTVAEVTHEALFEHWTDLRKWIDESRDDLRFHQRAADAVQLWVEGARHTGRLWRSPDLDLLRNFFANNASELSPDQVRFLEASQQLEADEKRAEKSHRRLRWLAITLAIVTPIIICIAGLAVKSAFEASHANSKAQTAMIEAMQNQQSAMESQQSATEALHKATEMSLSLKVSQKEAQLEREKALLSLERARLAEDMLQSYRKKKNRGK